METLGSLIDKLTIKNIRLFHLKRKKEKKKTSIVKRQIRLLQDEIEGFLSLAIMGKIPLTDEKFKLYNVGLKRKKFKSHFGELINNLSHTNIKLWYLEDEVRKKDVPDKYIVRIKRQIDYYNQIRNDLIDSIDRLLKKRCSQARKNDT